MKLVSNQIKRMGAIFVAFMMVSMPTFAHVGHGGSASFSSGLLHPLTGYDHLAALIFIGFFASSYSTRQRWKVLGYFSLALMGGFALGVEWAYAHQMEILVSLSLLILPGALWAYHQQGIVKWFALGAIMLFSACHGVVQGAEAVGNVAGFGIGSLVSSLIVIMVVSGMCRLVSTRIIQRRPLRPR